MSIIENGLRADIMRKRMEDKNTLKNKGSLYVGTGDPNYSKSIIPSINTGVFIKNGVPAFESIFDKKFQYGTTDAEYTGSIQSINHAFIKKNYSSLITSTTILGKTTVTYSFEVNGQEGDMIQMEIRGTINNRPIDKHFMIIVPLSASHSGRMLIGTEYPILAEIDSTDVGDIINVSATLTNKEDSSLYYYPAKIKVICRAQFDTILKPDYDFTISSFKYRILK